MTRLAILPALLAAPAWAQDVDCANAMTQTAMNICAGQSYDAADADLNAAYGRAVSVAQVAGGDAEALLRQAQRAWIAFRDAACAAEAAAFEGGSMQPLIQSGCLERVTRARIADLEAFAANWGG